MMYGDASLRLCGLGISRDGVLNEVTSQSASMTEDSITFLR
jgi:hypothetical protein